MIREEDARQLWCPFARVSSVTATERNGKSYDAGPAVNRWAVNKQPHLTKCIASNCMAWRSPNGLFGYCGLVGHKEDA